MVLLYICDMQCDSGESLHQDFSSLNIFNIMINHYDGLKFFLDDYGHKLDIENILSFVTQCLLSNGF